MSSWPPKTEVSEITNKYDVLKHCQMNNKPKGIALTQEAAFKSDHKTKVQLQHLVQCPAASHHWILQTIPKDQRLI